MSLAEPGMPNTVGRASHSSGAAPKPAARAGIVPKRAPRNSPSTGLLPKRRIRTWGQSFPHCFHSHFKISLCSSVSKWRKAAGHISLSNTSTLNWKGTFWIGKGPADHKITEWFSLEKTLNIIKFIQFQVPSYRQISPQSYPTISHRVIPQYPRVIPQYPTISPTTTSYNNYPVLPLPPSQKIFYVLIHRKYKKKINSYSWLGAL